MKRLFNHIGTWVVLFSFALMLLLHHLLGGDNVSNRSDWFGLVYILPVMLGLAIFLFINVTKK